MPFDVKKYKWFFFCMDFATNFGMVFGMNFEVDFSIKREEPQRFLQREDGHQSTRAKHSSATLGLLQ